LSAFLLAGLSAVFAACLPVVFFLFLPTKIIAFPLFPNILIHFSAKKTLGVSKHWKIGIKIGVELSR
jgi:hypothetical protein